MNSELSVEHKLILVHHYEELNFVAHFFHIVLCIYIMTSNAGVHSPVCTFADRRFQATGMVHVIIEHMKNCNNMIIPKNVILIRTI